VVRKNAEQVPLQHAGARVERRPAESLDRLALQSAVAEQSGEFANVSMPPPEAIAIIVELPRPKTEIDFAGVVVERQHREARPVLAGQLSSSCGLHPQLDRGARQRAPRSTPQRRPNGQSVNTTPHRRHPKWLHRLVPPATSPKHVALAPDGTAFGYFAAGVAVVPNS
jgi:hypothetical protein